MVRWLTPLAAACSFPTTKVSTDTPSYDDPFTTSPAAAWVEDHVPQLALARYDVLWVVDGAVDPDGLAALAPVAFDFLVGTGVDYHVGVVSADLSDPAAAGHLVEAAGLRWIDPDTPNPVGGFGALLDAVPVGTPQPRGAAFTAIGLEGSGMNLGFARDDTPLNVVVVGDGSDATDPSLIDEAGFVAWLDGFGPDRSFACLTVGAPVSDACATTAASLGGVVGDAADPDALQAVAIDWTGLERTFALTQPYVYGLEVEVITDGAVLSFVEGADYTYDPAANAITFVQFLPSAGSDVVLRYFTET